MGGVGGGWGVGGGGGSFMCSLGFLLFVSKFLSALLLSVNPSTGVFSRNPHTAIVLIGTVRRDAKLQRSINQSITPLPPPPKKKRKKRKETIKDAIKSTAQSAAGKDKNDRSAYCFDASFRCFRSRLQCKSLPLLSHRQFPRA